MCVLFSSMAKQACVYIRGGQNKLLITTGALESPRPVSFRLVESQEMFSARRTIARPCILLRMNGIFPIQVEIPSFESAVWDEASNFENMLELSVALLQSTPVTSWIHTWTGSCG